MASDSKDESKIHKAEGRALKLKRKSSKSRGGSPYFYSSVVLPPVLPQQQFESQPTGRGRGIFHPEFTASINLVGGNVFNMSGMSPAPGPLVEQKTGKSRLFKAEPLPICKMENDCMNDMARC